MEQVILVGEGGGYVNWAKSDSILRAGNGLNLGGSTVLCYNTGTGGAEYIEGGWTPIGGGLLILRHNSYNGSGIIEASGGVKAWTDGRLGRVLNSASGGGSIVLFSVDGSFPETSKVTANGGRDTIRTDYYGGNGSVSFENIF